MQFDLGFELITNEQTAIISIMCRPVYLRSISNDLYDAGVIFDSCAKTELKIIHDYLIYQMGPVINESRNTAEINTKRRVTNEKLVDIDTSDKIPGQSRIINDPAQSDIKKIADEQHSLKSTTKDTYNIHAIENLKQDILRMSSSMKALEDSNRLILETLSRIERKL